MTRIQLTRDSVAMGDDAYAPHEEFLDLPGAATIGDAVKAVLERHYLATIYGGAATWLVVAGGKVHAVVAQQWDAPRWITDRDVRAPAALHFRYLRQQDPDEAFVEHCGDTVPPEYVTVTISWPLRGLLITCRLGERRKEVYGEQLVDGDHEWSIVRSSLEDRWTRPFGEPISNADATALVAAVVQQVSDEGLRVRWD